MSPGRWLRMRKAAGFSVGRSSVCSIVVSALTVAQRGQQACNLLARAALELGLGGAALCGQRELVDATVVLRRLSRHDLATLQRLQRPAEEAGIETEVAGEVRGGAGGAMRDLVQDARLLQSEGAVQQLRHD